MADPFLLRDLQVFVVSLPVRRPHLWAGLTTPAERRYVVVKLTLDDGTVGWGETQAIQSWGGDDETRFGETPGTVRHVIETLLKPGLEGVDLRSFETMHAAMRKVLRGHPYAKAAIDVAVMDAVGRRLGVPVYQLLGGKVRDRIPIAHSIGLMEIETAIEESVKVIEEGVSTLKLKIGVDADRDVALVRDIRKAIGDAPRIRVDANQGYKTWREAVAAVERMMEYDISYAEQLVDGVDGMAEVSARVSLPVMADESCWTERDVVRLAQAKAAQYLSVYYTKPGGVWKASRLLTVAGAHGFFSDINGSGEFGIGNAANLQLAAASPEVTLAGTIPITSTAETIRTQIAGRKYLDDIIVEPFEYADGCLTVPDGPGLGVEVDEAKVLKYAVD